MERLDLNDVRVALARHAQSGELYVTRYASVWRGNVVGTRIIEVLGPITAEDLGMTDEDMLVDNKRVLDAVEQTDWAWEASDPADADWLQSEEDAERVTYPFGVR